MEVIAIDYDYFSTHPESACTEHKIHNAKNIKHTKVTFIIIIIYNYRIKFNNIIGQLTLVRLSMNQILVRWMIIAR